MNEIEKILVSVTELRPQPDGSADARVFIRLRAKLASVEGPWMEVFPSIADVGQMSMNEAQLAALRAAHNIIKQIAEISPSGLEAAFKQNNQGED